MNDVLIVNFDELTQARATMSELRRLDDEGVVAVRTAAIVVREVDGRFWVPEDEEHIGLTATAAATAAWFAAFWFALPTLRRLRARRAGMTREEGQ